MVAELRFGLGLDTHPRDESRPLFLGGIRFEGEPGLAGHSDADVVCHALADALLGAAGLGDLGTHFQDGDREVEGLAGLDLLARAVEIVREAGLAPVSCDAVVIAERPHVAPRRDEMRAGLARVLGVPSQRVSVKATRPEGLGLIGDGAGCLALAVLAPA
ncbi:MAG TPA: 2-C-methyl-D-erythritol 2,4-cyclodiphosphate synthase [Actinomycetota bacterium]|jgi:2-C-methyl-D-erythritol 2,4-cyclodiphosphate synthase|nr:2-C-methyl-D-erythritol 2,4-cyclodiphosphate synthase [Actinomycetota bacterium]